MTKIDDGGPAFPIIPPGFPERDAGMSLRDWFAGQALGVIHGGERYTEQGLQDVAAQAYATADAMLAEIRKAKP